MLLELADQIGDVARPVDLLAQREHRSTGRSSTDCGSAAPRKAVAWIDVRWPRDEFEPRWAATNFVEPDQCRRNISGLGRIDDASPSFAQTSSGSRLWRLRVLLDSRPASTVSTTERAWALDHAHNWHLTASPRARFWCRST